MFRRNFITAGIASVLGFFGIQKQERVIASGHVFLSSNHPDTVPVNSNWLVDSIERLNRHPRKNGMFVTPSNSDGNYDIVITTAHNQFNILVGADFLALSCHDLDGSGVWCQGCSPKTQETWNSYMEQIVAEEIIG